MPAVITTAISPSVSRPRKSTRMTLTMLRPCASGTLLASKKSPSRGSNGALEHARTAAASRATPQSSASAAVAQPDPRAAADPASSRSQPRHHQREDDHRQDLDHELGEAQVGRAEQHEDAAPPPAPARQRDDRERAGCAPATTVTTPSSASADHAPFVERAGPAIAAASRQPAEQPERHDAAPAPAATKTTTR